MNLRVITPPSAEPVSIETLREQLRIDLENEEALLGLYLAAAREHAEGLTRRAFMTQTLELLLDAWPAHNLLKLPRPPLQSVTSVKYLDKDGVESTWTDYQVDARSEPGKLYFKTTPSTALYPSGAIAIRYVAGYASAEAIPQSILQAMLMLVGHMYENREATTGNNFQIYEVPLGPKTALLNERAEWFDASW